MCEMLLNAVVVSIVSVNMTKIKSGPNAFPTLTQVAL